MATTNLSTSRKLTSRRDFPVWYITFQVEAKAKDVWKYVDPDDTSGASSDPSEVEGTPSLDDWIQKENEKRRKRYEAEQEAYDEIVASRTPTASNAQEATAEGNAAEDEDSGEEEFEEATDDPLPPAPVAPTLLTKRSAGVLELYASHLTTHAAREAKRTRKERAYEALDKWVKDTVSEEILTPAQAELLEKGDCTLRALIRILKRRYAPSDSSNLTTIREEYAAVLDRAASAVNPNTWIRDFRSALLRASQHKLPEVQGTLASKTFLRAIQRRFAPSWANLELIDIIKRERSGAKIQSVSQYVDMFEDLLYEDAMGTRSKGRANGVFATLAGRSDDAISGDPASEKLSRSESASHCACGRDHKWTPSTCNRLKFALTGEGAHMSSEEATQVRSRINGPEYSELRAEMARKGWLTARNPGTHRPGNGKNRNKKGPPKNDSSGSKGSTAASTPKANLPSNVVAYAITEDIVAEIAAEEAGALASEPEPNGIYTTRTQGPGILSSSTVLDNCGALHLVNDVSLFEEGSVVYEVKGRVEAGATSYPIVARGTRVLRNVLNGANGLQDLTLRNVALVDNFHINIVSEYLLRKTGIWYSGFDNTLRVGDHKDSVEVKKLLKKGNITFIDYQPRSSYLGSRRIPSSDASIMSPLALVTTRAKRRSQEPVQTRADTVEMWHLRSGHLSRGALEKLVLNARGVKIRGVSRLECQHCATTYAKQVISRRTSERKATRPFHRISWDLFDYPTSFDANKWLLVIKDEYTGRLFVFPRVDKTQHSVFVAIRTFERWVWRQYGLALCKIRQDGERAVIAINGLSEFQIWASETGIEVEQAPSYTKEPNGGAERAGQELVTKAIAMLQAAGLPSNLWVEAVQAAAFLYNMSPHQRRGWLSPIQVEADWLRDYIKRCKPAHEANLPVDSRPQWGGVYAYGCRAYPLKKEREANKNRRDFKVTTRGHIGYLVGYVANSHNLYRVWIPSLREVIITRNVTFDERTFYSKDDAKTAIQGKEARLVADEIQEPASPAPLELQLLGVRDEAEVALIMDDEAPLLHPSLPREPQTVNDKRRRRMLTPESNSDPAEMHGALNLTPPSNLIQGDDAAEETWDAGRDASPAEDVILDEIHVRTDTPPPRNPDVEDIDTQPLSRSDSPTQPVRPYLGTGEESAAEEESERVYNRADSGQPEIAKPRRSPRFGTHFAFLQTERNWDTFFETYMPERQKVLEEADQGHYPFHCFVFTSVHQAKLERVSAIPSGKIHIDQLVKLPKTWRDVQRMPEPLRSRFIEACNVEINKLKEMGVWDVIDESKAKNKPIPLKWVFTYKLDQYGYLDRCKARICVRGDLQEKHPLEQTYAATLAAKTFRVAMALAAQFDLEIHQFDVVNAFLNAVRGPNDPPITCYLPDGFKKDGKVVELRRALYGLRDAPLLWYKEFSSTLLRLGLHPTSEDPCLFQSRDKKVLVLFYVDDILVLYHKDHAKEAGKVMKGIKEKYELKDQGPAEWYLGIRITRDRTTRRIYLSHDQYIERIAKKFDLVDSRVPTTPLPLTSLEKFDGEANPQQVLSYQEKIGSILYTSIMIRPDVAFACALLSRFLTNPSPRHHQAANQVIRYLYHTRYLAIRFGISGGGVAQVLLIASDASFADDEETRRSSQGFVISLFGGPIQWKAARQSTVTTSTTEAELLSLEYTAKETMALKRLFGDLELSLGDVWKIYCDNQQTIRLVVGEKERISTRVRHVDIQNMWLRQEYAKRSFQVVYLPTDEMPADGLTKTLSRAKFERFRALLNLQDVSQTVERSEEEKTSSK